MLAGGRSAPLCVPQAIISLTGGAGLTCVFVVRQGYEPDALSTGWRALALTKHIVAFVDAAKDEPDWDAHSRDQSGVVTGWVRSRAHVESVELTDLRTGADLTSTEWHWGTAWKVCFRDGTSFDLPLFGGWTHWDEARKVEEIAAALRETMPRS
jgi:hypothetical protein